MKEKKLQRKPEIKQQRQTVTSLGFSLKQDAAPYYQQLISQIIEAIEQQKLCAGDRLPSTRELANALGVSRSTLVNAYDRLLAEGILVSKTKSGVFVAEQAAIILKQSSSAFPNGKAPSLSFSNSAKHSTEKPDLKSFDSGADVTVFPHKAWQKCMKNSWTSPDDQLLEDNYQTGYPPLKQAIANYVYQLRGLRCQPEQIIVTAGNRDSLSLLHHTLRQLNTGSLWLTENPSYPPIKNLLAHWNQNDAFLLPVDRDGCQLPSKVANPIVILTPNRQYPSGIAMSSERKQQWLHSLNEQKLWVIEDDYDNEFTYQGRDNLPLMQADHSERVFYVGSFSKVLFRGLRLGFIVAPATHISQLRQSRETIGAAATLPMQAVLTEFMQSGEFSRHINRMRRHYRSKRDHLLALLTQHLTAWFSWQTPSGGMHVIIHLQPQTIDLLAKFIKDKTAHPDQWLANQLAEQHISLSPLSSYFAEQELSASPTPYSPFLQNKPAGFVLGFTKPPESQMQYMIERLATYLNGLSHEC